MMKDVYIVSDNIISPVGNTTAANFHALVNNQSGVKEHVLPSISATPFYASLFNEETAKALSAVADSSFTKFEQLLIFSVADALRNSNMPIESPDTILVISSTKGNVSLLENTVVDKSLKENIGLYSSAKKVSAHFNLANTPLIISNACISGLTALLTGKRLLETGVYKHAVVTGADVISSFILSGFQSFQAVSAQPCKPFDKARNGINLGEAAATIILSSEIKNKPVKLTGGAVTNDANHISGPSRSGQELCMAINKALKQAGLSATDIGFISAHGTATIYNDEMESKAITLAALQNVEINSLKGYYGHTLGAAGMIESIVTIHSMKENLILPTMGYQHIGVTSPINVSTSLHNASLKNCIKTASGFGGCNAAVVFSKQ